MKLTKNEPDEQLMNKVKSDNLDALSPLFDRYHIKLYNFFLHRCFDEEASRDLTQTVFYRIIRYRKTYNNEYKFRTWIYQLARNVFNDHYKKNKILISDFVTTDDLKNNEPSDAEELEKTEQHQTLYRAMKKLPDDDREILVLNRFQGLKYEDIAEIQGSSVGAIKVKAHRAIKKLREHYFETE